MQVRFLGGAGSVSGTKLLVEHEGRRLLVDCGLFQGLKQLRLRNRSALPVPTSSIDAVVLSHAHIGHSGFLPCLVALGFKGPVYATQGTADLCRELLPEAGRLHEAEASHANLQGYSRHEPALPLYTEEAARQALQRLEVRAFDESFEPVSGMVCRMTRAGHVPGASSVHLQCAEHSLMYSGDLGGADDLIMHAPAAPCGADLLLLESTYGQQHFRMADALSRLARLILRAVARGGVVVIPAYAAGPAQQVLRALQQLKRSERIPDVPVYLNSRVAERVCALYAQHASDHRLSTDDCASMMAGVTVLDSEHAAAVFNPVEPPCVLIAAEGEAHGWRMAQHLKAYATDPRNAFVFAGHQAAGSRGAAMLAGASQIKISGEIISVRAEVCALDAMSGHADRQALLDWTLSLPRAPQHIYLMHGEPEAADSLRQALSEQCDWPCSVAEAMDLVNL